MFYDRGTHYEFASLTQELSEPGTISGNKEYPFTFKNVEKQYESYHGINVKLRYRSSNYNLCVIKVHSSCYHD